MKASISFFAVFFTSLISHAASGSPAAILTERSAIQKIRAVQGQFPVQYFTGGVIEFNKANRAVVLSLQGRASRTTQFLIQAVQQACGSEVITARSRDGFEVIVIHDHRRRVCFDLRPAKTEISHKGVFRNGNANVAFENMYAGSALAR